MQRKPRTHLTYRYTLDTLLRASYKKKYVEDATRDDVLDFMTHCYELGFGARTVYDKVVTVLQLFKSMDAPGSWRRATGRTTSIPSVRSMSRRNCMAMFRAATEDEATLLKFVLGSGFRDQEIRYVEWKDIDFRNHDVRVKAKPTGASRRRTGRSASFRCRRSDRAAEEAEGARGARPNQLVFPNGRGKPDSEMDMVVKRVADAPGSTASSA